VFAEVLGRAGQNSIAIFWFFFFGFLRFVPQRKEEEVLHEIGHILDGSETRGEMNVFFEEIGFAENEFILLHDLSKNRFFLIVWRLNFSREAKEGILSAIEEKRHDEDIAWDSVASDFVIFHGSMDEELAGVEGEGRIIGFDHDPTFVHIDEFPIEMAFAFEDEIRRIAIEKNRADVFDWEGSLNIQSFEHDVFAFVHILHYRMIDWKYEILFDEFDWFSKKVRKNR